MPRVRELAQRALYPTHESVQILQEKAASALMGRLAIGNMSSVPESNHIMHMARGGNFKAVRANLIKSGKANEKQPMSLEQKKLRKRKRRKK